MISVIVPVYKNATLVEYCLSLLVENLPSDAELIVVDDASGTETLAVLKSFDRARLIEHHVNRGNTVAYNTGAAAARGDVLVFVDSDVFVSADILREFSTVLAGDDRLGAVGSLLLYPHDYTIQHAGIAFDTWGLSHLFVGRRPDEIGLPPIAERQAVTAALFACHRRVFEQVGGFDETYRDGLEDVEYCLRCREQGYRNVLLSRFPALHVESASRGPHKHIRRTYNYSIFFSRWSGRFRPDLSDYVRASVDRTLPHWPGAGYPAPVLNFCTTPNWLDLARVVAAGGVPLGSTYDLSGSVAEAEPIDLFRMVPLAFQRSPSNLLFVVDHFGQLARNRWWFGRRPVSDLVVDRHANVVTTKRFEAGEP